MRLDEDDPLRVAGDHPQNEVRVEAAAAERESHPSSASLVPQQEELGVGVALAAVIPPEVAQVAHEPSLALVERRGGDGHRRVGVVKQQRLVQVPVEVDAEQGAVFLLI